MAARGSVGSELSALPPGRLSAARGEGQRAGVHTELWSPSAVEMPEQSGHVQLPGRDCGQWRSVVAPLE